jgi:hypothetical protein
MRALPTGTVTFVFTDRWKKVPSGGGPTGERCQDALGDLVNALSWRA